MSLINDALKRAREAQPKKVVPAAGPSLRPVEAPRAERGPDLLLPLLVLVILALAAVLLGMWWHSDTGVVTVRAKSTPESAQPMPAIAPPVAIAPKTIVTSNVRDLPHTPTTTAIPVATSPTTNTAFASVVAPVEPPKPAPITYKLQSLFYRPGNPAAVINGKTVFPGDRVGDAHVMTIGKDSATIITGSGQSITLELP